MVTNMITYPPQTKAHALAKHLTKTLSISLSHSKEIVAYRYGLSSFNNLISLAETNIPDVKYDFYPIPSTSSLEDFKAAITPHIPSLKTNPLTRIFHPDSAFMKVASNKLNHLSTYTIENMLNGPEAVDWNDTRSIIEGLMNFDDSTNLIQSRIPISSDLVFNVNQWIKSSTFGLSVYGKYQFDGQTVAINIQELDLEFSCPSPNRHLQDRKWFTNYLIGYLSTLTRQFIDRGYQGTITIKRINEPFVKNYFGIDLGTNHAPSKGQQLLNMALLDLGGEKETLPYSDTAIGIKLELTQLTKALK